MKEKIVVTGGAGFIGSHLAHKLVSLGYHVVIIDNLLRGQYSYIEDLVNNGEASFILGDIRDYKLMCKTIKDSSNLFHLAAVCINYSLAHPQESLDVNVQGTFNVLKAAHEAGVDKVIFASSASVYGNPDYLPMDENHPLNPLTPYCVAKIADEYLLQVFARQGLKYVAFRNFNVYGLRQNTDAFYTSVISTFIEAVAKRQPPIIFGTGSQSMDFVYVDDVVDANIQALHSNVQNQIFNIGSGTSTSISDLFNIICELTKFYTHPIYAPQPKVLVTERRADITKAKRLLGFNPKTGLEEGLKRVIAETLPQGNIQKCRL